MTDERPFCTSCGERRPPGTGFCTLCGAPAAAPPARGTAPAGAMTQAPADHASQPTWVQPAVPQAAGWDDPPPDPSAVPHPGWDRPVRRRRGRAILAAVLLTALVAAGSGGAAWWLLREDEAVAAIDRPAPAPAVSGQTTTSPSPTGSASAFPTPGPLTPSGSPTTPSASPSVSCWDGSTAVTTADCGEPKGLAGLQWLFRGIDATDCVQAAVASDRTIYSCGDEPLKINFSHWRDHKSALRYYKRNTGGTAISVGNGIMVIEGIAPNSGEFKTAVLYEGQRWGATLYSSDPSSLPPVIAGLQMRPGRQYAGR